MKKVFYILFWVGVMISPLESLAGQVDVLCHGNCVYQDNPPKQLGSGGTLGNVVNDPSVRISQNNGTHRKYTVPGTDTDNVVFGCDSQGNNSTVFTFGPTARQSNMGCYIDVTIDSAGRCSTDQQYHDCKG